MTPDLSQTVDSIAAVQQPDGMIPWFPEGHADPWNHVEAAMALDAGGRRAEAEAAYHWLVATQRPDGAWHQYYRAGEVEETTLDANVTAYVATGVWHHFLATRDTGFLQSMWPVVEAAVGFVLDLQTPRGRSSGPATPMERHGRSPSSPPRAAPSPASIPRWPSGATWDTIGPVGKLQSTGSDGSSSRSRAPSCPRAAGRWTGTTRS